MKAYFNLTLVDEAAVYLPITDRGFAYGDGLFETIMIQRGKIQHLGQHLNRLKKGMEALNISGWSQLREEAVQKMLMHLCEQNSIHANGRARIHLWRKSGGLYTPTQQAYQVLITAQPTVQNPSFKQLKVSFSKTVRILHSSTSAYKTMSALPYVMAGMEKKDRDLDDLILLSTKDHISECIASNIFWIKKGIIYTPSLRSGCIDGIRRGQLIHGLRKKGHIVRRTLAKKSNLLQADGIFNCNVAGIQLIRQLDDQQFTDTEHLIELLSPFVLEE